MNILQKVGGFLAQKCKGIYDVIESHKKDTNNPHRINKGQVGLGNVDNTADTDKPLSKVQQEALGELYKNISEHTDNREIHMTSEEIRSEIVDGDIPGTIARTETVEYVLSLKVDKEEGKGLMPLPSETPGTNNFLCEDGTWKEVDLAEIEERISDIDAAYKNVDTEITNRLNAEVERATAAESGKVDKVEGKGLSANDFTNEDKTKLTNIGSYVSDVSLYNGIDSGSVYLKTTFIDSVTGDSIYHSIGLPVVSGIHEGLMTPAYKRILDNLGDNDGFVDLTGTLSNTWQVGKPAGAILKNSGGIFELRDASDSAYTDLTLNGLTVKGNVAIEGESFVVNSQTVETADNLILLNKGEVGAGVTKGIAGLEIDRGTQDNYKVVFDESDDRFKVGVGNDVWPIMIRDKDSDLVNGDPLVWDSTTKRAKTDASLWDEFDNFLPKYGGALHGDLSLSNCSLHDIAHINLQDNYGHSGSLVHMNDSGTWIGDYTNALILSTNGKTSNGIQRAISDSVMYQIWDEGNDGSGSGLDADLLDGKHGNEYALKSEISFAQVNSDWNANTGVAQILNKPVALKNPQGITFTGAVTGTYDGSSAMTVNIPTAVAVPSLGTMPGTGNGYLVTGVNGHILRWRNILDEDIPSTIARTKDYLPLQGSSEIRDGNLTLNNGYFISKSGADSDLSVFYLYDRIVFEKGGGTISEIDVFDFDRNFKINAYDRDIVFTNNTNIGKFLYNGKEVATIDKIPSFPSNNVTGSGTSGYLAKFMGTNTVGNGPALGSSTTTYLRNDGTWATPPNTTYTAGVGLTLSGTTFSVTTPVTKNSVVDAINSNGEITFTQHVTCSAGIANTSDMRFKRNIESVEKVLDRITDLSVFKYNWEDEAGNLGKKRIGVSAQEMEERFPEATDVMGDNRKTKTVDLQSQIAILFAAIKELCTTNITLQNEIKCLKKEEGYE